MLAALALLCTPVALAGAAEPQAPPGAPGDLVDSRAWQAHFESWVEEHLVHAELRDASIGLPAADPNAGLPILDQLEEAHAHAWRDVLRLPAALIPPLLAPDAESKVLEAARAYAGGDKQTALSLLREPDLRANPRAIHLRAQILDELTEQQHPIFRLGVIDLYRRALRLAREQATSPPQTDRARLRIGQIYLQIGFVHEARSTLAALQHPPLAEPWAAAARASLAEAAYLQGDAEAALESLAALDPAKLSPEAERWRTLRHADALFAKHRYAEAADAYAARASAEPSEPLASIRHAFSLLALHRPDEALALLEPLVATKLPPEYRGLAALLQVRALRASGKLDPALKAAEAIAAPDVSSEIAAFAALESLECQRLLEHESLALPPGAVELAKQAQSSPAAGLLAYRVAATATAAEKPRDAILRIARLLPALPNQRIQLLVQDDLTRRLSEDLADAVETGSTPDAELLDIIERHLRPQSISENALLLAVQALAQSERRGTCVRWARTLARREQRPLRRGLAAWREVTCLDIGDEDRGGARRRMNLADSGKAGPFALALATLSAEAQLRLGDLERALRSYERALQTFSEPVLQGPVLLRAGELALATNRPRLARQRLTQGLSMIDAGAFVNDPFRKAGLLALARLSLRGGDTSQVVELLRNERENVDPWWSVAYAYLLLRSGGPERPEGENPFAHAVAELDQAQRVKARVSRFVESREQRAEAARVAEASQ